MILRSCKRRQQIESFESDVELCRNRSKSHECETERANQSNINETKSQCRSCTEQQQAVSSETDAHKHETEFEVRTEGPADVES